MDAAIIAAALGGHAAGCGWIARCPAHDDRVPSLSIATGRDGRTLLHCFAGCPFEAIVCALRAGGLDSGDVVHDRRPDPACATAAARAAERRITAARTLWAAARPIAGTLAERYLRNRAIRRVPATSLRFTPDARHPTGVAVPAMIAAVIDGTGALAGVHRTFLAEPGCKADLDPPRAMLGRCAGGAVRLSTGDGPLVAGEGIETALSLLDGLADHRPRVWAALSTTGIVRLELPAEPGDLVIAPDGDAAGAEAAETLARRAFAVGWRIKVMTPPNGLDWNDVARQEAGR